MLRTFAIAACLLAFVGAPALAGEKRVTVHVKGLACPFCTYNLEKRIRTLEGVPDEPNWQASVEKGTASFDWKADVPFDEAAVREQIRKAGFTPDKVEVSEADGSDKAKEQTIKGRVQLTKTADGPDEKRAVTALQIVTRDNGRTMTLRADERADRRESYDLLKAFVNEREKDGQQVNIALHGMPVEKNRDEIVLTRWEPADFGAEVIFNIDELACERCSTGVMRALMEVKGVLHVEADHEEDRVLVWTQSDTPDTDKLRNAIEEAGFKVTHVHVRPSAKAKKDE